MLAAQVRSVPAMIFVSVRYDDHFEIADLAIGASESCVDDATLARHARVDQEASAHGPDKIAVD
jgi:hypothetical protein